MQSARAQIIERRTYLRPLDKHGTEFETPEQAWGRVIGHQRWLWERAQGRPLDEDQAEELVELYSLFMDRKVTVSGRTRWLGGTEIARQREASQFNCSFATVQTVHDVVDTIWLLLQGCGVGFRADVGVLNGFTAAIPEIEIIRSTKILEKDGEGNPISNPALKGCPDNREWFDNDTGVWHISVGDSAEAWAKFFGKLMAFKGTAKKLVVDFTDIRPAGYRLSGYGWISSGDEQIAKATKGIFDVMNRSAGKLLSAIDILDVENHLGTILSSRRSAEIALYPHGGPEWKDFAVAKKDNYMAFCRREGAISVNGAGQAQRTFKYGDAVTSWGVQGTRHQIAEDEFVHVDDFKKDREHRQMSNNSLVFYQKPTRRQMQHVFKLLEDAGGSEPGFINGEAALKRAPYFKGVNPCAEILLGDKSFCNLVETAVCRFNGDEDALHRAHWLVARANYRQTCVDLKDGVLQETWHELNEFLRLCGVGVTGVVGWEYADEDDAWDDLRSVAHAGANGMADELGLPRPKLITTVKPSGTQTKVFGQEGDEIGEGVHKPLGRFIFNNVNFSANDPMVTALRTAGYYIFPNPTDESGVIVRIPVEYNNIPFDKTVRTMKKTVQFDPSMEYPQTPDSKMITPRLAVEERDVEIEVEVNLESAVSQLDRYKRMMNHYVDHNCSITISYDLTEVPAIIDWLLENWDVYVGVSFIYRNDPTKTAEDLGYAYLPQEVVDSQTFYEYATKLQPVNFDGTNSEDMLDIDDCATGACPVR